MEKIHRIVSIPYANDTLDEFSKALEFAQRKYPKARRYEYKKPESVKSKHGLQNNLPLMIVHL